MSAQSAYAGDGRVYVMTDDAQLQYSGNVEADVAQVVRAGCDATIRGVCVSTDVHAKDLTPYSAPQMRTVEDAQPPTGHLESHVGVHVGKKGLTVDEEEFADSLRRR